MVQTLERTWEEQRTILCVWRRGGRKGWEGTTITSWHTGHGPAVRGRLSIAPNYLPGLHNWKEAGSQAWGVGGRGWGWGAVLFKANCPDPLAAQKPGHSPQLCHFFPFVTIHQLSLPFTELAQLPPQQPALTPDLATGKGASGKPMAVPQLFSWLQLLPRHPKFPCSTSTSNWNR